MEVATPTIRPPRRAAATKATLLVTGQLDGMDSTANDGGEVSEYECDSGNESECVPSDDASSVASDDVASVASLDESLYDTNDDDEAGGIVGQGRKTKEQVEAEKIVALRLELSYPKEYNAMRKGLFYLLSTTRSCSSHVLVGLYNNMLSSRGLDNHTVATIANWASELGTGIDVPVQQVAETFSEISKTNGGRFSTLGAHVPSMYAAAMFCMMVEKTADCIENGSDQAQGMQAVLGMIGLHGDAMVDLSMRFATDTPLDCAVLEGKKLVALLNAIPGEERLKTIFHSLAKFGELTPTKRTPNMSTSSATTHFHAYDQRNMKNAAKLAANDSRARVSVSVLVPRRSRSLEVAEKTFDFSADAVTLKSIPIGRFVGDSGWPNFHTHTSELTDLCCVARGHMDVANPCSDSVFGAFVKIIDADAKVSPNLTTMLAACIKDQCFSLQYPSDDDPPPEVRELADFMPVGSLLAVVYNAGTGGVGSAHRPGQKTRGACTTTFAVDHTVAKSAKRVYSACPFVTVCEGTRMSEYRSMLTPPWRVHRGGTVDFYIIPSFVNEREGVDSDAGHFLAGARQHGFCRNPFIFEPDAVKADYDRQKKVDDDKYVRRYKRKRTPDETVAQDLKFSLHVEYPPSAFPAWHEKSNKPVAVKRLAIDARRAFLAHGEMVKNASLLNASVIAAMPGNDDFTCAAASFAAACSPTASS